MKKPAKLVARPEKFAAPLQFDFFESDDRRITNTIALWDVAPRGVFRTSDDVRPEKSLKLLKRVFQYGGATYQVSLTPARFEVGGVEVERYPSEREQLVEEVVRQIAVRKSRLAMDGGQGEIGIGVDFSLYEVFKELERTGHKFSYAEIREALHILHKSHVEIVRLIDENGKARERVVSGTTFPNVVWADRSDPESMTKVTFNWLMSHSVMRLDFRQVDYELLMRMPSPVERWLYRCINHDVLFFKHSGREHTIRATEVVDGSGLVRRRRFRDSVTRVAEALGWLQRENLIDGFTNTGVFEGRKKVDAEFTLTVSDALWRDMGRSDEVASQNRRDFEIVAGGAPSEFVAGTFEKKSAVRKLQAARLKAVPSE